MPELRRAQRARPAPGRLQLRLFKGRAWGAPPARRCGWGCGGARRLLRGGRRHVAHRRLLLHDACLRRHGHDHLRHPPVQLLHGAQVQQHVCGGRGGVRWGQPAGWLLARVHATGVGTARRAQNTAGRQAGAARPPRRRRHCHVPRQAACHAAGMAAGRRTTRTRTAGGRAAPPCTRAVAATCGMPKAGGHPWPAGGRPGCAAWCGPGAAAVAQEHSQAANRRAGCCTLLTLADERDLAHVLAKAHLRPGVIPAGQGRADRAQFECGARGAG